MTCSTRLCTDRARLYYRSDKLDVAPFCAICAGMWGYDAAERGETKRPFRVEYDCITPVTDFLTGRYLYDHHQRSTRTVKAYHAHHAEALLRYRLERRWQSVTVKIISTQEDLP